MSKVINLDANLTKSQQKEVVKAWKLQLAKLQQPLREAGIPVIVMFEGFSGAGKGSIIGDVIAELDPRQYTVHTVPKATEAEERMPFLAPFWHKLPPRGEMAIFDHSWYNRTLSLSKKEQARARASIALFERQLADDGYLILKFFLHISGKEQAKRLKALESDPATAWRVDNKDWRQNRKRDKFTETYQSMMDQTNQPYAPWHTIDNETQRFGTIQVLSTICTAVEQAMESGIASTAGGPTMEVFPLPVPDLEDVSLEYQQDAFSYEQELKAEREQLHQLHSALYLHKIPVILAFEGWDAAGKG
ncbi:MAG: phosphate--AMP phosphotransferase, partial [Eubacteriales bacterium]